MAVRATVLNEQLSPHHFQGRPFPEYSGGLIALRNIRKKNSHKNNSSENNQTSTDQKRWSDTHHLPQYPHSAKSIGHSVQVENLKGLKATPYALLPLHRYS
jgi:hypothetical protein